VLLEQLTNVSQNGKKVKNQKIKNDIATKGGKRDMLSGKEVLPAIGLGRK